MSIINLYAAMLLVDNMPRLGIPLMLRHNHIHIHIHHGHIHYSSDKIVLAVERTVEVALAIVFDDSLSPRYLVDRSEGLGKGPHYHEAHTLTLPVVPMRL